jgi:calcineurin-like phosphoesterase family protein
MKGLKYLVLGTHDWDRVKLNMTNPDSVKTYQERLSEKFASLGINGVFNSARLTYSPSITEPRQEFLLSHFPYKGSGDHGRFEGKERFEDARPIPNSNPNLWLLHGHVHNEWHVKDKMINVGVDVNEFKPITLTQVMKLVADSKAGE